MLLLKRRRDQVVKIGPDIEVRVVSIERGAVTLGINAPGHDVRRVDQLPEETDRDRDRA